MTTTSRQTLPLEIWLKILKLVPDPSTLNQLAKSSRQIYAIAQCSLYRHFGHLALRWAAERGCYRTAIMSLTLSAANINERDSQGQTPLYWAAQGGHTNIVRLLLGMGEWEETMPVIAPIQTNYTSEQYQAMQKEVAMQILPNLGNYRKVTPILIATLQGHANVVKLLLSNHRLNPNAKDDRGYPALMSAIFAEHTPIIKLLLADTRVDPNSGNGLSTILCNAVEEGREEVVRMLVENKRVDLDMMDCMGNSPLDIARRSQHMALVKLLVIAKEKRPN
ncbi:hypothetical protein O988_07549 [Pseudogymnoascus sp. VKM F-3808]|nr:hypothetical protein O988_07549 [Pseudogymnoascus sp. VKM F-3808]